MKLNSGDASLVITNTGFQFLLQDVSIQTWSFLLHYLDMIESRELEVDQALNLILEMSLMELGAPYRVNEGLTVTQQDVLKDLLKLGFLYQNFVTLLN